MKKPIIHGLFLFATVVCHAQVATIGDLKQSILGVIEGKSATVAVSVKGLDPDDTISINGDMHLPMQSVFKLHVAISVLHQVDLGKFSLQDSIHITPELIFTYRKLWSPLRKKYPAGGKIPIHEIMEYMVAWSDNLGCDVLLDQIGGAEVAQKYMQEIGIHEVAIVDNEMTLQSDWNRQYQNWSTTNACNKLLQKLYENEDLLGDSSYQRLLATLKGTTSGQGKLRGQLPAKAMVAHKTGYSGKNERGIIGASNDIGIVFLPDNTYFYISVFVSDSQEDEEVNQEIIASIAHLAWDYFLTK